MNAEARVIELFHQSVFGHTSASSNTGPSQPAGTSLTAQRRRSIVAHAPRAPRQQRGCASDAGAAGCAYSLDSATTGSRRAALRAGAKPKITPVAAAQPKAINIGSEENMTSRAEPRRAAGRCRCPVPMPMTPPIAVTTIASDEELREDVVLPRARGHAHADLARPLGDPDEHDVHDADAADEQRDARRSRRGAGGTGSAWPRRSRAARRC